jgi:hypothetical protein
MEWPNPCVRAIKRDYVRVSTCPKQTMMYQLSAWINYYNGLHPHEALGYRSSLSLSQLTEACDRFGVVRGHNIPLGQVRTMDRYPGRCEVRQIR